MPLADSDPSLLWPAADVGGTSARLLLVAATGDDPPEAVIRVARPTPRGLGPLVTCLRDALAEASRQALERGHRIASVLALGTPGRLQTGPDGRQRIAPRSATNLEAVAGELDGIDLAAELAAALGLPRSRVFWDNDAVVQGRFLIGELLHDPQAARALGGGTVVCINPGTGLGGCVADVDTTGAIEVFTDSHISELLLHPVALERDLRLLRVAVRSSPRADVVEITVRRGEQHRTERLPSPAGKQAEDLLSGTGLSLIASGLEGCGAQVLPSGTCFGARRAAVDGVVLSGLLESGMECIATRAARFVSDLGGLALARLLAVLRDGTARKSPSFPDWTPAELARLRGVSHFVLGGGITKTPLGQRMIAEARSILRDWPDLQIFEMDHIADDAGALGAFSLIPEQLRRRIEENPTHVFSPEAD